MLCVDLWDLRTATHPYADGRRGLRDDEEIGSKE